jgi:hypothetical protein
MGTHMPSAAPGLKPAFIAYLVLLLLGSILVIFLEANVSGSAGPLGVVVAFSSAVWAGRVFVEKNLRRATRQEHLRFSLVTAVAPVLLVAILVIGTLLYLKLILGVTEADMSQGLLSRDKRTVLALAGAIAIPLGLTVSWLGFGYGVRTGEKRLAKPGAR